MRSKFAAEVLPGDNGYFALHEESQRTGQRYLVSSGLGVNGSYRTRKEARLAKYWGDAIYQYQAASCMRAAYYKKVR